MRNYWMLVLVLLLSSPVYAADKKEDPSLRYDRIGYRSKVGDYVRLPSGVFARTVPKAFPNSAKLGSRRDGKDYEGTYRDPEVYREKDNHGWDDTPSDYNTDYSNDSNNGW